MDNHLKLCRRGLFEGEFVVTNQKCSFSIGDYIEVFLREPPYDTGETILGLRGKVKPIIALPLTITECCHSFEITVITRHAVGASLFHWIQCLDIGKISVVTPCRYEHRQNVWYMPKIDGWIPSLFGRVQAPSQSNRQISI